MKRESFWRNIYEHDRTILNKANNAPTFMSGSGESNIDITLATKILQKHIKAGRLDCSCTTSDYNLIILELEENSKIGRNWITDLGFNFKKADWQKFGRSAEENFN